MDAAALWWTMGVIGLAGATLGALAGYSLRDAEVARLREALRCAEVQREVWRQGAEELGELIRRHAGRQ